MKYNLKKSYLLLLLALLGVGIGFSSCSSDDETVIVPKTLEEYKSQMIQFVNSEITIVENCVVGYNKGDFKGTTNYDTYKADYLSVLNAAKIVFTNPDVTIEDIVTANKTFAVPGKAFTNSLFISDCRPLNDSIVSAEALNAATITGTAAGQVPETAKATFTAAITNAKKVRDAATTIDRQVTETIATLSMTKQIFVNAIIK